MQIYVGITDYDWYQFLKQQKSEEVNFWKPGTQPFKALQENEAVFFNDRLLLTKEMVSNYFQVDIRTIERYISANIEELKENGYQVLRGKELREFIKCYNGGFGTDINVGTKTTVLVYLTLEHFLIWLCSYRKVKKPVHYVSSCLILS